MARYRVGNAYLSEEEYEKHNHKTIVFWLSIIVFAFLTYQTNAYLKLHYLEMFSSKARVALSVIPGLAAVLFMRIFYKIFSFFIGISFFAGFLFMAWKVLFYFLG